MTFLSFKENFPCQIFIKNNWSVYEVWSTYFQFVKSILINIANIHLIYGLRIVVYLSVIVSVLKYMLEYVSLRLKILLNTNISILLERCTSPNMIKHIGTLLWRLTHETFVCQSADFIFMSMSMIGNSPFIETIHLQANICTMKSENHRHYTELFGFAL